MQAKRQQTSRAVVMQQHQKVIFICLLVVGLIQGSVVDVVETRTVNDGSLRATNSREILHHFTTGAPDAGVVENSAEPSSAVAPATLAEEPADELDPICYSCHDRVEEAKNMINAHADMVRKQKALLNRQSRQKKATQKFSDQLRSNSDQSSRAAVAATAATVTTRYHQPDQQSTNQAPESSISSRTLNDAESKYTIVSRLRVRSAANTDSLLLANSDRSQTTATTTVAKRDKATILKQMKHNEQLHLNETCRALIKVDECLKEIMDKCLGDLQFHTLESVVEQWIKKYDCLQRLNPGKKLWTGLTRISSDPKPYTAIPRPISSPEEVRIRLHKLLGYEEQQLITSPRPTVGVMLKPTLTQSASHSFNTIPSSGVQLKASAPYAYREPKYRISQGQTLPSAFSLLLIIPCFLIVMIIVMLITNFFRKD